VDDNRDAADTLAVLAGLWGFEAEMAYDGRAALLAAESFRPDFVVLDIIMPGMDGFEVACTLRQRPDLRGTRLVALSANSGPDHLGRVREVGFDYYLTKPAEPGEVERLFHMLAQALRLAERTESLAQQNVELARETKDLLIEVKEELREVKDELKDVKEELRDIKESPHAKT
jgi:CheY-like chemotaxis protein